jgi:plasmid stability protein
MKSITVRNIPDEILEAVRILSIKERRSLNSELIVIMENGLNSMSSAALKTDMKEDPWKKLAGKWKDKRSTAEIIDDVYSSRTIGRDIKL